MFGRNLFLLILGLQIQLVADDSLEQQLEEQGVQVTSTTAMLVDESTIRGDLRDVTKLRRDIVSAQKKYDDLKRAISNTDTQIARLNTQSTQLNAQLANVRDVVTNNRLVGAINTVQGQLRLAYQRREKLEEQESEYHGELSGARDAFVAHVMKMQTLAGQINEKYETCGPVIEDLLRRYNQANGTQVKLEPTRTYEANLRKVENLADEILTAAVRLRRDRNTYWAPVELNGEGIVEMVVDSGASFVSLPYEVALEAGLKPGRGAKEIFLQVADGRVISGHQMTIKSMRVGIFTAKNVECVVLGAEAKNSEPLLGMSFLGNFKFEIDAGKNALVMTDLGDNSNITRSEPDESVVVTPTPTSQPTGLDIEAMVQKPAAIKVKHFEAIPLTSTEDKKKGYRAIPEIIEKHPATVFGEKISKHEGYCEFDVLESGHVILACSYHYEGNLSGGWQEDRWLAKDFIERGWTQLEDKDMGGKLIGNYESRDMHLFTRYVEKGDHYRIRCNKYSVPIAIVFGTTDGKMSAAGTPPFQTEKAGWELKPVAVGSNVWKQYAYKMRAIPSELTGAKIVLHNSDVKDWLNGEITATQDYTVYVAMIVDRFDFAGNYVENVPKESLQKLNKDGWTEVEGEFLTDTYKSAKWNWKVLKKSFKPGQVHIDVPADVVSEGKVFFLKSI